MPVDVGPQTRPGQRGKCVVCGNHGITQSLRRMQSIKQKITYTVRLITQAFSYCFSKCPYERLPAIKYAVNHRQEECQQNLKFNSLLQCQKGPWLQSPDLANCANHTHKCSAIVTTSTIHSLYLCKICLLNMAVMKIKTQQHYTLL